MQGIYWWHFTSFDIFLNGTSWIGNFGGNIWPRSTPAGIIILVIFSIAPITFHYAVSLWYTQPRTIVGRRCVVGSDLTDVTK